MGRKKGDEETELTNFRCPKTLKAEAVLVAKAESRDLTGLLVFLLTEHVKKAKARKKKVIE